MSLIRWDPFRKMTPLRDVMDRMMEEAFRGFTPRAGMTMSVPIDVFETSENYCVKAEVPGVRPDDLNLTVSGNTLTIQGECRDEQTTGAREGERQQPSFHLRERRFGRFFRSVTLPTDAQMDKVDANFEHGILTLTIPKSEGAKPKQIPIKSQERPKTLEGQIRQ